jgi:hypothetical protein
VSYAQNLPEEDFTAAYKYCRLGRLDVGDSLEEEVGNISASCSPPSHESNNEKNKHFDQKETTKWEKIYLQFILFLLDYRDFLRGQIFRLTSQSRRLFSRMERIALAVGSSSGQ